MLLSAFGEGNFFIELTPQDGPYLQPLASLAAELNLPIVATNDVLYLHPEDAPVAEALARAGARKSRIGDRGSGAGDQKVRNY